MNNGFTVFGFEMKNYFGSKSFIISTILLCLLSAGIMFFPRIKEQITGGSDDSEVEEDGSNYEVSNYGIYDPNGILDLDDEKTFNIFYPAGKIVKYDSVLELKRAVENEDIYEGFVVNSNLNYDFYVLNKGAFENSVPMFSDYLSYIVKLNYCKLHNLDVDEFNEALNVIPEYNETVLGKDGGKNYWYCYILVILVFMVIIMYGTSIASSVTNEKSNRSIEILVTSVSSNSILFGKVFAGALSALFQFGTIGVSLLGSYAANKQYWGGVISMLLDVPSNVLALFLVFAIGGFLFYAFLYGALGALVSKIEDLNKSAGTAQMIVTLVYVIVLTQLGNADGIIIKVLSYLPISSYSAMFVRVAMGNVSLLEVVISAVILYASVIGMGFVGGKIFRSSTLRYGNPIKLSAALKGLKEN